MYSLVIRLEKHQDEFKPIVIVAGQYRLITESRTNLYYVKMVFH